MLSLSKLESLQKLTNLWIDGNGLKSCMVDLAQMKFLDDIGNVLVDKNSLFFGVINWFLVLKNSILDL